jgi:hypothetical protein
MIINGIAPPSSNIHIYYIILETLKAAALFFLGLLQADYFRLHSLNQNVNKNAAA